MGSDFFLFIFGLLRVFSGAARKVQGTKVVSEFLYHPPISQKKNKTVFPRKAKLTP